MAVMFMLRCSASPTTRWCTEHFRKPQRYFLHRASCAVRHPKQPLKTTPIIMSTRASRSSVPVSTSQYNMLFYFIYI